MIPYRVCNLYPSFFICCKKASFSNFNYFESFQYLKNNFECGESFLTKDTELFEKHECRTRCYLCLETFESVLEHNQHNCSFDVETIIDTENIAPMFGLRHQDRVSSIIFFGFMNFSALDSTMGKYEKASKVSKVCRHTST